jgi:hypothetical protein
VYKYGFFEFSAKFAKASVLQSIWLQSKTGEINVADFIEGTTRGNSLTNNYHCFDANAEKASDTISGTSFDYFDANPSFNPAELVTYGLDWDENGIDIYINGDLVSSHSASCLNEPMHVIFSIDAVAAELPSWSEEYTMRVNYFRHWTKAVDGEVVERVCSTLLATEGSTVSYDPEFKEADVCSTATPNGKCIKQATHSVAQKTCFALGGRLCSAGELASNVAKASSKKCELDQRLVWTLTPCIVKGTSKAGITSRQGDGNSQNDRCITSTKSKIGVVCCAGKSAATGLTAVLASIANDTLVLPGAASGDGDSVSNGAVVGAVIGSLCGIAIIAWIAVTQKRRMDSRQNLARAEGGKNPEVIQTWVNGESVGGVQPTVLNHEGEARNERRPSGSLGTATDFV